MYKRILVPVDGSGASDRGLKEAIRLAKVQRASVCLLHVVDKSVITQHVEGGAVIDHLLESLRSGGRKVIGSAEGLVRKAGLKPKSILIENFLRSVADVIVEQARKFRADVIVMGTHGRRGITRMVLGSAAEGVVRNSHVPVLLVRGTPRKQR